MTHRILGISFQEGWATCTCGEIVTTEDKHPDALAAAYTAHRTDSAAMPNNGQHRAIPGYEGIFMPVSKVCIIAGCDQDRKLTRGMCDAHYQRWRRQSVTGKRLPMEAPITAPRGLAAQRA